MTEDRVAPASSGHKGGGNQTVYPGCQPGTFQQHPRSELPWPTRPRRPRASRTRPTAHQQRPRRKGHHRPPPRSQPPDPETPSQPCHGHHRPPDQRQAQLGPTRQSHRARGPHHAGQRAGHHDGHASRPQPVLTPRKPEAERGGKAPPARCRHRGSPPMPVRAAREARPPRRRGGGRRTRWRTGGKPIVAVRLHPSPGPRTLRQQREAAAHAAKARARQATWWSPRSARQGRAWPWRRGRTRAHDATKAPPRQHRPPFGSREANPSQTQPPRGRGRAAPPLRREPRDHPCSEHGDPPRLRPTPPPSQRRPGRSKPPTPPRRPPPSPHMPPSQPR